MRRSAIHRLRFLLAAFALATLTIAGCGAPDASDGAQDDPIPTMTPGGDPKGTIKGTIPGAPADTEVFLYDVDAQGACETDVLQTTLTGRLPTEPADAYEFTGLPETNGYCVGSAISPPAPCGCSWAEPGVPCDCAS